MTTATAPKFTADEDKRIFLLDGQRIPSITDVIQDLGYIDQRWFTERDRLRGNYVHSLTQFFDEGDYDPAEARRLTGFIDADPNAGLDGYVESWRKFVDRKNPQWLDIERRLFSPTLRYCGKPDRRALIGKREHLWEIKSGPPMAWHAYQTGAQDVLFGLYPKDVRRRAGIHLYADGVEAAEVPHLDYGDASHFFAMLDCYWTRQLCRAKPIPGEPNGN